MKSPRSAFIQLCLVPLILSGCVSSRISFNDYSNSGTAELVVKALAYDDKGLPLVGTALEKRPSSPGDHFTLVRLLNGRPSISYDIAVVRQKPDFTKPLRAVYEWTGKGFSVGVAATEAFSYGAVHIETHNTDEAVLALAVVTTPLVIGTVGGFVIGIADGIKQTAVELANVVLNGEEVTSYTLFDYDGLDRLARMRMFTPDGRQELVRTEFEYAGAARHPVRTVARSLVERKERVIQ